MQTKKRLNSVIFNALLILALLIQAAVPMRSAVYAAPAQPREMMTQLEIKLTGLEDLGPNATYEGWVMVNGSPVSTGKFTVNSMGEPSQSEFTVLANAAEAVRDAIARLTGGDHTVELDNGSRIVVPVRIDRTARRARIDFSGTSPQLEGNFNAPLEITK